MTKIRDMPFDPADRERLRAKELRTSDDLWWAIGTDFQKGLAALEEKTGIARGRLIRALAAAAAESKWRLSQGEVVCGLALLVLLALAGLRLVEAVGGRSFPVPALTAEAQRVVIAAPGGLPAFHVLDPKELNLAPKPRTTQGFSRKKDAAGRFLLRPLPADAILRESDLGPARVPARALAERWIVTLLVDASKIAPHVVPGAEVLLVLAPEKEGVRPAVEADALILALEKGTGAGPAVVTVAIALERRAEVTAALGSSEIFLGSRGARSSRLR